MTFVTPLPRSEVAAIRLLQRVNIRSRRNRSGPIRSKANVDKEHQK
jgi:hypothetical protein